MEGSYVVMLISSVFVVYCGLMLTLFGHFRLQELLAQSELQLRALARTQLALEEEIQVKSHSLYIDEVSCFQIRQPITIHTF